MKLFLGADHRGLSLKHDLYEFLSQNTNHDCTDCGALSFDAEDDYNDYAKLVAKSIVTCGEAGEEAFGILICGSAQGMAMQANRFHGVRAAICDAADQAEETRSHNDANILCLPADHLNLNSAIEILDAFISTRPLEDAKYQRRTQKLDEE